VFVALGIQHPMRHIVIMPSPAINIFLHYLLNGAILEKKKEVTEHKTCVLIFPTNLSGILLTLRTIQRDIAINVHRSTREAPVILVRF